MVKILENKVELVKENLSYDEVLSKIEQAKEFVEHSLKIIKPGKRVAMLLKIQFLESAKRRELFEENPPKYIYICI